MFDIYRRISVMGSTGSVGTQTLQVVRDLNRTENEKISVTGLAAGSNYVFLADQAREFGVKYLYIGTDEGAEYLARELSDLKPVIFSGESGLEEFACAETDLFVTAIVGMRGLKPTLKAIERGIDIALANKETLVTGGDIVMKKAAEKNVKILPVDSEHSAVFQCLRGHAKEDVEKIILTASGGPFRGYTAKQLENVTLEMALGHPTWKMGKKITVDCATMMNKGLEVIEASKLFGFGPDKVDVVIHPQSVIHSMVEYKDGSVKAQLSVPDMRLPIIQAIAYPKNVNSEVKKLKFTDYTSLTFEKPDRDVFRCFGLAYDALKEGKSAPVILNGANEAAVGLFLKEKIKFTEIAELVEGALQNVERTDVSDIDGIMKADALAREYVGRRRK